MGIAKLRKDELEFLAEKIGLLVSEGTKKIELKYLIDKVVCLKMILNL